MMIYHLVEVIAQVIVDFTRLSKVYTYSVRQFLGIVNMQYVSLGGNSIASPENIISAGAGKYYIYV